MAHQPALTQSREYAEALCRTVRCRARFFLIHDAHGLVRGMTAILVREAWWLGGGARINRGPVACGSPWNDEERSRFLWALRQAAFRQRWWYLRCAFGWPETPETRNLLAATGWRHLPGHDPWGSHRLSLRAGTEALRANLLGKWRNLLGKAERMGCVIRTGVTEERLRELLDGYAAFQRDKGFDGISLPLLRALASRRGQNWGFHLLTAHAPDGREAIGSLVTITHGDGATWLIGMTSEEGRRRLVNYPLLWRAILDAREQGLAWFDLGGVNAATPAGIRHFKEGVGATPYLLVGEWSWGFWRSW
ncbi:MAG: GNAT family N-acetyltransferase [Magnetococcales bacterium]|nr:GNAT family N-acetyltransferase [Magnetococcales bacterium]